MLLPMLAIEVVVKRDSYLKSLKEGLTRKNILFLLLTPIFQMIWSYGLVFGSENMI